MERSDLVSCGTYENDGSVLWDRLSSLPSAWLTVDPTPVVPELAIPDIVFLGEVHRAREDGDRCRE